VGDVVAPAGVDEVVLCPPAVVAPEHAARSDSAMTTSTALGVAGIARTPTPFAPKR
jgi:hypothetical protein